MSPEQVVLFIIGSIIIIAGAYFTTYFLAAKSAKFKRVKGRMISVVDRFALSKDKSICAIEILGKVYLVAVTTQNAVLLDTLEAERVEEYRRDQETARQPSAAYQPAGIIQKGIYSGFKAVKNSGFWKRPKAERPAQSRAYGEKARQQVRVASEEDDLDIVYRKIQARKAKSDLERSRGRGDGF